MPLYQATITPNTLFTTPIKGDSLFGYACWEYKHMAGEQALYTLLENYMHTPPFVMSDAFPKGYIPRPQMPLHMLGITPEDDNIKAKKKTPYIPIKNLAQPVTDWLQEDIDAPSIEKHTRTHNSINRQTFSTGSTDDDGKFAPYNKKVVSLQGQWHIYIAIPDASPIPIDTIQKILEIIGQMGYGGGKTTGLGKFTVVGNIIEYTPSTHANSNAYITLAPHVTQSGYNTERCYYKPFTRFGKMGDVGALSGNPFKSPVLMINSGAIITPKAFDKDTLYIGRGIGGVDTDGQGILSATIPQTIQQGYTPVIPVYLGDV